MMLQNEKGWRDHLQNNLNSKWCVTYYEDVQPKVPYLKLMSDVYFDVEAIKN